MANNYYRQAAKEVDSSIRSGKAVNEGTRRKVLAQYANYLNQLSASQASDAGAMDSAQGDDRARMANVLAARGGAGNGSAQFNYGRLNAQHEGAKAGMLGQYANKRGDMLTQQGQRMDEVGAADAALMAAREGKIGELARLLEDRAWQRQVQEQQLALQRAANARASADGDWQREQALSAEEKQEEMEFRSALAAQAKGAKNLVGLAHFARSWDRDLNDYYDMMGRPDLVAAAGYRRVIQPKFPLLPNSVLNIPYGEYESPYAKSYDDSLGLRDYGRAVTSQRTFGNL